MFSLQLSLIVVGCFAQLCTAQAAGWQEGQVNTTMCQWESPRAAVVRDTLYIDGGYLWWKPGLSDGSYGAVVSDGNPLGLVYMLNFSTPFNTSTNFNLTGIFTTLSKASGGGAANNIGPQYYDGAMFANDYEWFTYGGKLRTTDQFKAPAGDAVASWQVYPSGPPKEFNSGFILGTLPNGVTRYVTDGAAVSVPSENLGYYFAGLRSASSGSIFNLPGPRNQSVNADQLSTTLIEINMAKQGGETWKNSTLPTSVPGRANAEVVWVPVSEKGILVAIGGVIFPSYANVNQTNNASATAESEKQSPLFMSTVSIYDVAKDTWYEQQTTDAPGQLSRGCTVVASAQDGSSHNIYWYGGFDGLHPAQPFSDAVYVLSIPSFKWVKVNDGTPSHARAGHRCTKPYPDQMLVVGGFSTLSGTDLTCVEGGIIQIYNLSSNQWIQNYDPNVWSNYTVSPTLQALIGGTATGSATQTTPSGGFSNSSLAGVFTAKYDTTKIVNWYPYKAAAVNTSRPTLPLPSASNHSGTPKYLAPVLGVVLGLFFITLIILAILLWRRRKLLRSSTGTQSEAGTMDNRRWVTSWLRATPADAKAPTVTTDDTVSSPYEDERPNVPEMAGVQVHEMMDTSKPVELHDTGTGFVALGAKSNGHSHSHSRNNDLASSPSVTSQTSQASSISHWSQSDGTAAGGHRPNISPLPSPRAGSSPSLDVQNQGHNRIVSGISNLSDADRGHLRGISETSVSTEGAYATPMERGEGMGIGTGMVTPQGQGQARGQDGRPSAVSPLTPPTGADSRDYLAAGAGAGAGAGTSTGAGLSRGGGNGSEPRSQGSLRSESTKRRSNFSEGLDENERR
ncbi:hypothetical protein ONS95_012595 [Cadophora gregata]|uniref:uncharacterized protein n=1 Tax=Cadophora gregata TaxID=51156 RepID=UPI0026DD9441|nr:uncharacterized protein ONS95_012595 [Cadophora gregata]KAK0118301.1 hypothetical protein ONS95_012595 [Cadophora gregata]KAK0123368.1 hypothetical protein ONS96_010360 [Cadophora gregata f. sp. sojae]